MDENRIEAYYQLIQKLLECSSGEDLQILNAHSELLDPGLLQTIIVVAKQLDDNGNLDVVNFLINLALQLGKFLGSDQQPTAIRKQTADILLYWGSEQFYISQFLVACECWQQCLIIYQAIHDRQGEANSLVSLGIAYHSQGQFEKALNSHKQSLDISREIKDRQGEAASLGNLGIAYGSLGEYEEAITSHEKSLAIKQEIKDPLGEANSLKCLGNAYHSLAQVERAINFYEKSLDISREIKNRLGEEISLGCLGNAYLSLGQFEQAITFFEKSLAISLEIKHRLGEADCLRGLGNAYYYLGQFERSINYHEKSLLITRKIKDRLGEANSLGSLGNAYDSLGQFERSINYHEEHLIISREIKHSLGEGNALGNLGGAYYQLQQTEKAIENSRNSVKIATPKTMPDLCFKAGRNLGDIGFTQGDWHLALEGYEPALQAVEQLRKGSTTDKRRQEIIAKAISVYANAVQCYINLKQYDKAVETADRSQSRHLADLFYTSKDLYPKGQIPPEVEEYYRLQQKSDRLRFSDNDPLATTPQPTPNGDAIIEQIKKSEEDKQKAWLKIRSKDEVLAGQLQPDPLSFKDMQALIPDAETAILNFYTTSEHTHIFILRQNQPTKLYTCEGQGLETLQNWLSNHWLRPYFSIKQADTLAVAKLLKRKLNDIENISITAETVTVKLVGFSEQKLERQQFDETVEKMQVKMHKIWLIRMSVILPKLAKFLQLKELISEHLNGIKELIIIPHLYLHQIPFAALPLNDTPIPQSETPSEQTRGLKHQNPPTKTAPKPPQKQPEYLSDRFRIRIVPSCQILSFCHQRGNLKPATMGIVENATGDLLFTGYECETLATMHNVDKNSRLQYQQATISNYQNLLERVQVLHSSHHAASDLNNSLESKLLLFDGDINLGRIFTWRFKDLAEVFLSCCETNLTLTPITDDPLSIASGFLCAGARNVVSTLWAVDDLATALFCILYYQEKQDKSRSDAIREAQFKLRNLTGDELSAKYQGQLDAYFDQQKNENNSEEISKNKKCLKLLCQVKLPFVSPYYWAGFISQGLA